MSRKSFDQFEIDARLNDGQGTAGQLLKDQRLYENMNKVATDLSSLLVEIKKDPKKFLAKMK